eukprot:scaffold1482_cov258-Chaetoceros_neogracile.AAC.1
MSFFVARWINYCLRDDVKLHRRGEECWFHVFGCHVVGFQLGYWQRFEVFDYQCCIAACKGAGNGAIIAISYHSFDPDPLSVVVALLPFSGMGIGTGIALRGGRQKSNSRGI